MLTNCKGMEKTMQKLIWISLALATLTTSAIAGTIAPTPGPLLGAVAGPWGLVASALGYGAYRFYKAKR
jgi:hypothetical protein